MLLYVTTIVSKVGDNYKLINGNAIKYTAFDPKYFVTYTKCMKNNLCICHGLGYFGIFLAI